MEDVVKVKGILSEGFGNIPKLVMKDRNICIGAKGLYAYICSYAGNGISAFPSRSKICYDLHITKDTFYKYLLQLENKGYIAIEKNRKDGKFSNNIYVLNMETPCPKKSDTIKSDTIKSDTINQDTNNNIYNNNIYNNNNIYYCCSIKDLLSDKDIKYIKSIYNNKYNNADMLFNYIDNEYKLKSKSVSEIKKPMQYVLGVAKNLNYITNKQAKEHINELKEISNDYSN